ncbi:MAG: fused MFS/spermidine synthase [Pseudomonadota bacterium]
MKELSLLFGNSAQAAAATLAAFFTGIAAGNAFWGRKTSQIKRPLMVYGVLELCVTASALFYFAVYIVYASVYPVLFSLFESSPVVFTLAKFVLALLLFFPPAFFMGGTLPVMTQYLVINKATLGKRASFLYVINTLGAASGALAVGFYLPQTLGINTSYLLAMVATLLVGLIAMGLGRTAEPQLPEVKTEPAPADLKVNPSAFTNQSLLLLAGLSGFASLALQVLWVRMFAQVLHNSVYTYSAILSVFLIALAVGGGIARELARRQLVADWVIPTLLSVTSIAVATSPILFYSMTGGGSYIGGDADFSAYLFNIFYLTVLVIGIPTTIIGVLLPYLFKLAESEHASPGAIVGRLVTVNTVGAILGSILAGFILLEWLGLWSSLKVMSILYMIAAFWFLIERPVSQTGVKLVPVAGLLLLVTVLDTSKLPVVKIDPIKRDEALLKVWEGSDATVAVVRRNGHLRTKLNNWYTLGSTGDMTTQQIQTHLPMLLHPDPKNIFYLGLGTGITAGAALNYEVEEVLIAEIAPSAIKASEEFFTEYTNGLYDDSRVTVIAEDGRNVLRGTDQQFDLIISDLFIPWKAGTGTLYSTDHYRTALERLDEGGMYAQWLPLYQLTQDDFAIIARSMLEVFPRVTMWRGNFWGDRAVVALIGHRDAAQISPTAPLVTTSRIVLREQLSGDGDRVPLIAHYAGALKANDARISRAPLNSDSYPVIEYLAPINHRLEKAGQTNWFLGEQMLGFTEPYLDQDALALDPYLASLNPAWHDAIQAGYYLQASYVLKDAGDEKADAAKSFYQSMVEQAAQKLK